MQFDNTDGFPEQLDHQLCGRQKSMVKGTDLTKNNINSERIKLISKTALSLGKKIYNEVQRGNQYNYLSSLSLKLYT